MFIASQMPDADRMPPKRAFKLDDGRLIEERWTSLVREQHGRAPNPPRISSAYAGTAHSARQLRRGCRGGPGGSGIASEL